MHSMFFPYLYLEVAVVCPWEAVAIVVFFVIWDPFFHRIDLSWRRIDSKHPWHHSFDQGLPFVAGIDFLGLIFSISFPQTLFLWFLILLHAIRFISLGFRFRCWGEFIFRLALLVSFCYFCLPIWVLRICIEDVVPLLVLIVFIFLFL